MLEISSLMTDDSLEGFYPLFTDEPREFILARKNTFVAAWNEMDTDLQVELSCDSVRQQDFFNS